MDELRQRDPSLNPWGKARTGRHPQVFAAAVTFSLGLVLVRIMLACFGPEHHKPPASIWKDPLLLLMAVSAGTTLLYSVLRMEEGDFRALFLLTLGLFLAAEVLEYLASVFALVRVQELGTVLSFSVSIYGLLALTSAFYDYPQARLDPIRSPLVASCLGISTASAARALAPVAGLADERIPELVGVAALIVVAVSLITALVRSSRFAAGPLPTGTSESPQPSGPEARPEAGESPPAGAAEIGNRPA